MTEALSRVCSNSLSAPGSMPQACRRTSASSSCPSALRPAPPAVLPGKREEVVRTYPKMSCRS